MGRYYVRKQKSFEKGLEEHTSIRGISCGATEWKIQGDIPRVLFGQTRLKGPQRRKMSKAEAFQNCFL